MRPCFLQNLTDVSSQRSNPGISEFSSLTAAFAAVCAQRKDSIAVRAGEEALTYAALNLQANSIARALRRCDVARGSLVAIYLPRGLDMVAAMLGVCKAGGAYLPLDPTFPAARVLDTIQDARPALLITERELQAGFGDTALPTLLMEEVSGAVPDGDLDINAGPEDLAYVIYTSGSTGRPKGVMVSQRNVLRLLSETQHWFHFTDQDIWTMFHSFAFDFSVWEMWACLLTGGTLIVVPYETSRSPEAFCALLAKEKVTVLNQTPTAFGLLSQTATSRPAAHPFSLRYVIFGGEALNLRSLHSWVQLFGEDRPKLINMYGITETTVHVTYRRILQADIERETDSLIGEPIPDLQIHLLDETQQPVAPDEVGEMYIGGAGVALGYLHRPELTAERFLQGPFSTGRLYRSGDLARRRSDGELVYLGRADRQVKINGFRVEPGEIESALLKFPGVQQVCVAPQKGDDGSQFLTAYIVSTRNMDSMALAGRMAEQLPAHMRPTFYVQLAALPLTVNGKVDREALPKPEALKGSDPASGEGRPLAQQIAALWANLLQVNAGFEDENFFDAGGTSLQLLALRTALQQKLNRPIPVLWMFEHPSPRALASQLLQQHERPQIAPAAQQTAADRQRQSFARARALRSLPS